MLQNLKNRWLGICLAGLLVLGVAGTSSMITSCAGTETATQQIMSQTDDPYTISQAAYLDALILYNDLGEKYLKYKPWIETNAPSLHYEIMGIFGEMDDMLVMWEGFAKVGIIPDRGAENFKTYADMIIQLMLDIDAYLEDNGGEL